MNLHGSAMVDKVYVNNVYIYVNCIGGFLG